MVTLMQHIFAHEKEQKLGFVINEVSYLSHKIIKDN